MNLISEHTLQVLHMLGVSLNNYVFIVNILLLRLYIVIILNPPIFLFNIPLADIEDILTVMTTHRNMQ